MKTAITLLVLSLLLGGCSKTPVVVEADDTMHPVVVEKVADRNLINIEKPERFAVTAAISRTESDQIQANGIVAADVSRTYPVNALSSGRVIDVRVRLGDDVTAGQLMLTMTSPDMAQAVSDYQKFVAAEALAKIQMDRAELLLSRGAAPQKDVEVAQDTYKRAKIDTATAAEHIRILGGDVQHLSPIIEIHAPVAGTIIEQNVTSAAGVKSLDNSPNLFTIADLSSVWILCDVYENDLAHVHVGDQTTIEFNAYPGRIFKGRITNISKLLDPTTRSAKVRIELPNEAGLLRPNMFATAHFISQGASTRTVIPSTSILRLQDRDWVFVKVNDKQFRRTEVQAGPVNADKTQQVLSGIKAGDNVVNDALMFDREVQTSQQ
jgi:cobalt-zinc-cadmium efflux system membrane fusion protein